MESLHRQICRGLQKAGVALRHVRSAATTMLFYSFFKTLINKDVVVELKNDVMISGTLSAVDQFLNLKLENVVVEEEKCPHLASVRNCFVRGSTIRYVQLPATDVETELLQDATRKEHSTQQQQQQAAKPAS